MADKLTIGSFTFPIGPKERMSFKSTRELAKVEIPGAPVDYHDMGDGESTISWSGEFRGDNAYELAQQVDSLKKSGKEQRLLYGKIDRFVTIKTFEYELIRWDKFTYTLELVEDQPDPAPMVTATPPASGVLSASGQANSSSAQTTYTIKKGDTLWSLAQRLPTLKDGTKWPVIAKMNGISDPRKLQVGQVIKIPASAEEAAQLSKTLSKPTKPQPPKHKNTTSPKTNPAVEEAHQNWLITEKGYMTLEESHNEWNLISEGYKKPDAKDDWLLKEKGYLPT